MSESRPVRYQLVPARLVLLHPVVIVHRVTKVLRNASPLALALALSGCSGPERREEIKAELMLQPALNLGQCSSDWVPITGGNRSDSEPPAELLFSRGELF